MFARAVDASVSAMSVTKLENRCGTIYEPRLRGRTELPGGGEGSIYHSCEGVPGTLNPEHFTTGPFLSSV